MPKTLYKPIFLINDDEFIIISNKQLLDAIFKMLYKTIKGSSVEERYNIRRGKFLQEKVIALFEKLFGNDGSYFNEYKVDGKGQDVLVLNNHFAYIIEAKSGKEVNLSGVRLQRK